jgi:ABC-type multidrug transport system ATPase subunit
MEVILKVDRVSKTFRLSKKQMQLEKTKNKKKIAVNDVSFEANRGEIFGLLGPNGAGKTTILRMMATLIKADTGEIFVDGNEVKKSPFEVRSKIGFLTSELKLEDFFTPNYLFNYFSNLHGISKEIRNERRETLFSQFGINEFAEVKVANLSTGMKQKLSLVVSIAHDPDVIIFDEPTNGLDVITAKVVTDFLIELRNRGKSIILSTHIFSLVEKLCDRVGIIIDGKMVACDSLENLCTDQNLEEVFFKLYEETGGTIL